MGIAQPPLFPSDLDERDALLSIKRSTSSDELMLQATVKTAGGSTSFQGYIDLAALEGNLIGTIVGEAAELLIFGNPRTRDRDFRRLGFLCEPF